MNQLKEDHYYNYIIIIFRLKNKITLNFDMSINVKITKFLFYFYI